MAGFANMILPFIILLMFINGMFIFITALPSDQIGKETYAEKLGINDINNLQVWKDSSTDANHLISDSNGLGSATNTASSSSTFLWGLFVGVGNAIVGAFNIVTGLIKYMGLLFFGYVVWIDFFLNPAWSIAFAALGGMIKGFFFIIQLFGFANILLPILTGTRPT